MNGSKGRKKMLIQDLARHEREDGCRRPNGFTIFGFASANSEGGHPGGIQKGIWRLSISIRPASIAMGSRAQS
jgi:hypothetical protein